MPIQMTIKAKRRHIQTDTPEQNRFIEELLNIPLMHHSVDIRCQSDRDGFITELTFNFNGVTIADAESTQMFMSVVDAHLEDLGNLFYLSSLKLFPVQPNEGAFLHTRFKPLKSKNARSLSNFTNLEIPERFSCPLSGDIMDQPVYDIRSPNTLYDQEFLMYWLNKSFPKLLPVTRLPYDKAFLKVNYDLKIEIDNYVKEAVLTNTQTRLNDIFTKYEATEGSIPVKAHDALLKLCAASITEDQTTAVCKELGLLLSQNINLDHQDPNTGETALHKAIRAGNELIATTLIYVGAKLTSTDHQHINVLQLIRNLPAGDKKQTLLYASKTMGLITLTPQGEPVLVQRVQPTNAPVAPTVGLRLFDTVSAVNPSPAIQGDPTHDLADQLGRSLGM